MLRVIRAEESLRRVTETAAGSGLIKQHESTRILNDWRREARLGSKGDFSEGTGKSTTLGSLAVGGFGLVVIKKKKDADDAG